MSAPRDSNKMDDIKVVFLKEIKHVKMSQVILVL